MEQWRKDARSEAITVDLEALVPQDHLLRREVNAERGKLEKKPFEHDEDDDDPQNHTGEGITEKTASTTDPDSGIFVNGEHEKQSEQKIFMRSTKRRLNESLGMQKRNTQCVIRTIEAWPQLQDGSGLNILL